jgi:hypothetical protein
VDLAKPPARWVKEDCGKTEEASGGGENGGGSGESGNVCHKESLKKPSPSARGWGEGLLIQ